MKLYYYVDPEGNFGDDLNPLVWRYFLSDFLNDDPDVLFIGIGTILNNRISHTGLKVVLGAGLGYGKPPEIDSTWRLYGVRGPETAQALGLNQNLALTDPASLLPEVLSSGAPLVRYAASFMPHHVSKRRGSWRAICEQAGVHYLDPAQDIPSLVNEMRASRRVICEAMHAAIVADAYRIPWVPVVCYDHILPFKWVDWCRYLSLEYKPVQLPAIYNASANVSLTKHIKSEGKRLLRKAGIAPTRWSAPLPRATGAFEEAQAVAQLARLRTEGLAYLSSNQAHAQALARVHGALALLRDDLVAGRV
ncbi:MAG: polysaccharide pyruvyl transferase [Pusillimonas sp.]|nr:polysaccharide pyruvyl transferase [Pusillimonas sp.]